MLLIEIADWTWEHRGEVTLNALLLLILRKFIIREFHKVLHLGREGELRWLILKVEELTGEKYNGQPAFLKTVKIRYIKNYSTYLPKVIELVYQQRRKKKMNALKSTKFWLAIIGAIIPVLNNEFGVHLDSSTILGILGLFATAIAGIAHVDAKKAQNAPVQNGGQTDGNTTQYKGDSGASV
jgi:hypothetical protein